MIRLDFELMSPEAGFEVLAPRDQFGLQCSAVELIPGLLQDLGQGPGRRRQGLPAPRQGHSGGSSWTRCGQTRSDFG